MTAANPVHTPGTAALAAPAEEHGEPSRRSLSVWTRAAILVAPWLAAALLGGINSQREPLAPVAAAPPTVMTVDGAGVASLEREPTLHAQEIENTAGGAGALAALPSSG